ncbi:Deoxycytidine monophosphate (dCMP) deaminase [Quaeritorhiza haematococci]|nr:Deoxycytidine monophosphate (dCMP) deaminase [Quaeritorhiza haematococci]
MLIGLVGPRCSGKKTIADFLVKKHGFIYLKIVSDDNPNGHDRDHHANTDGVKDGPGPSSVHHKLNGERLYQTAHSNRIHLCLFCAARPPKDVHTLEFFTIADAHNYVMSCNRWLNNYVIAPLERMEDIEVLRRRPFFLLVAVEAPITVRYTRYVENSRNQAGRGRGVDIIDFAGKNCQEISRTISLEEFLIEDDKDLFSSSTNLTQPTTTTKTGVKSQFKVISKSPMNSLYEAMSKADVRIVNSSSSVAEFARMMEAIDITNGERLRPSWDTYFMKLCDWAARRSNCMKRRVGCILVKDRRIIATGYNGTPRNVKNCNEGGCARCNENARAGERLDICLCLHAEENALLEAGRERVQSGSDTTLYCNMCPCIGCAKKIVQVGVREVVYSQMYGMEDLTLKLLKEGGVKVRQHRVLDNLYLCPSSPSLNGLQPDEVELLDEMSRRLDGLDLAVDGEGRCDTKVQITPNDTDVDE